MDVEPRALGQVASRSDSQPNYPPRLEIRIKTRRVHFFFGCVCLCAGLSCLSRIVKCFCCTLFALLSRITLPLRVPLVPQLLLLINSPLVECTSPFFVISIIGLPRCERELGGLIVAVIVQLARQDSGTLRSGVRLGSGSVTARIAQILPRVNFPCSLDDVGI